MEQSKYMRAKDIAQYGSIGLSTVHKWVKEGKLPQAHSKLTPKCVVWLREDIENSFEELAQKGSSESVVV